MLVRHASAVNAVQPPTRVQQPPAELGRLGEALHWLAAAQGDWPPRAPAHRTALTVTSGDGFDAGCAQADGLADAGIDLLVVEGPEPAAPAFVVLCALLDIEPVKAIGTSTAPGWSETVVAVRDGLGEARRLVGDPERLATDPVLGHLSGLLSQSAVRRTPVVLGTSTTLIAAALLAERIAPGARRWWLAGSQPPTAVARRALEELELRPLLDLGLTVPGGAELATDLLVRGIDLVGGLHDSGPACV
jgi:nicotinate-nucleotide--dimethylbenzimidazole phosphoribosyltransferase